ncbi:uncharacterized protein SOCE26_026920 [Sorangium cellulosum]|uniref:Uncharacterized protein n=1 Tax=Sorangium cellulosum TaxID=56 RepID=A0A2L0EPU4_SORCE|nr:hypothetical protein [Sorangium cellulosum]AUX41282.1 uncharacterized protein SOCE26_026920 [Sorangium cellulosum]
MSDPTSRRWTVVAVVSLVPPGLALLLLAWGMPRWNSPDELKIAAMFLGSALTVSAVILWQAFVKITDEGVASPLSRPMPWTEIVSVRGGERKIELRSASRRVVVVLWPFRSRQDLTRYIAERLRRAGRAELVP